MATLLTKYYQGLALYCLVLEMATLQKTVVLPVPEGFQTLDGEIVSYLVGAAALRNGTAMLVDGFLVGTIQAESNEKEKDD
ncbi:hypothetical protein LJY25_10275 [Hymenobacter sp. BT175]|uniref:hypothetical protein n=1 Tax=Hymenobacter translucens TaxID=2886507 RepID=UPI001D0DC274|nr:hypothetical protein [Hymenobacter translucens]MCC2546830.1 hypothetical protein [Hymenobacter translucens]